MPFRTYHPQITLSHLMPEAPERGQYTFQFYASDDPNSTTGTYYECHIPGARYTRDGPTAAQYPEQELWMQKHSGLKEVWYVTFQTTEPSVMDALIVRLKRMRDAG